MNDLHILSGFSDYSFIFSWNLAVITEYLTMSDTEQNNPGPSKSIAPEGNCKNKRKRTRENSVSSDSSSSSSTGSSSSSRNSSPPRKRYKRSRKSKRTHRGQDKKLDKLIFEITNIKKQIAENYAGSESCRPTDEDVWIDDNVSRQLYESDHAEVTESEPQFSLTIGTKLKDPDIPKTPASYLEILSNIQRLGDPDWRNVRYSDVQKNYRHTPGFTELEVNDEVKRFDASRNIVNTEKAFAALSFALVKQRDQLEKEIRSFLAWAKDTPTLTFNDVNAKIQDIFVTGDFSKISNDALQLVCGHRAEVIQQRRETVLASVRDPLHKSMLRKIPPTNHNLFDSDKFTSTLEKAGGVRKVFWPREKDRTPATQADPSTSAPTQRNPVQVSKKVHYKAQPYNSRASANNPRSFRGRGGKQNSRRDNETYGQTRKHSPSSHRDRRGKARRY